MTDRETLAALVARCEAATGPDRELDFQIAVIMDGRDPVTLPDGRIAYRSRRPPHDTCLAWMPIRYTGSLDAAASLVPGGLAWEAGTYCGEDPGLFGHALVRQPSDPRDDEALRVFGTARTPALALCAAAMRAKMEEMCDD
jgi:hypothetical protein